MNAIATSWINEMLQWCWTIVGVNDVTGLFFSTGKHIYNLILENINKSLGF
jgi:hypothetical protein